MMAAEPSNDNSADVSAPSKPRPANDAQDGDLHPPTINGPSANPEDIENKRITSVEDQINSADVSVSGGSDTEASRAEWAKQKDGDKGHGRTSSSTKKPATFKAVSVNKTFLAAKTNATGPSSKTSDKPVAGSSTPPPGSATLSASRPRLIAKTGTGTGTSSPRFSSLVNGKPGTAPDPAAVWNKNRPTPAPEPKKLTDEELKKYGIHMASRLNEDDTQGQNKWADIDDDDEDWAPEAITWGDGTKTTLPHSDEPPAPASDNGSAVSKTILLQDKPASPGLPGPVSIIAPKPSGLPSGKGVILKSATQEKPTFVAKPPAPPAPTKSPWATLPPVEKTPVVPLESFYASRGPHKEQPLPRPTAPPIHRDGALDDSHRTTWRDRAPHGKRELFNSRSGRYEPVIERHGPPMRSDSQTRYPALLQRAPPSSDQPEPSPAFQTSRTAQDVPFGRRRGSSNVSGGSGSFLQRMSKASDAPIPPPEFIDARRSSLANSAEGPLSPAVLSAQSQSKQPDWASGPSPRPAHAVYGRGPPSADHTTGPPPAPLEDDIEYQKKLMREGVELARKRRQEEEAREEAARRERIQKKLDALGPPPERKSDMKENATKPVKIQQRPAGDTNEPSAPPPKTEDVDKAEAACSPEATPSTSALSPSSVFRRLSHGQDSKPVSVWVGPTPRPDRFSSWHSGTPRNVWGSPDSDRGLGNGTFNPDLGRVSGAPAQSTQSNAAPSPIAPPGAPQQPALQGRSQAPPPIGGLRPPRYATPGTSGAELASKWVAAVAENDKKLSAARLAERAGRERQMSERGLTLEDGQPTIKDTWRPVQVPGDGTRHLMGKIEVQSHPQGAWKAARDDLPPESAPLLTEESMSGSQPSVIGSSVNSVLTQPGQAGTPSSRPSRFFPAKDARSEVNQAAETARPSSPSPPPPTMEGHPVYEGDMTHPHVSLPRPHPVVKLPPSMIAAQGSTQQPMQPKAGNAWAARAPFRDSLRAPVQQAQQGQSQMSRPTPDAASGNWQDKINSLLSGGKVLSTKNAAVDAASKNALDHAAPQDVTTVLLPVSITRYYSWEDAKSPITKPMAEECFEEQEMGSLPQIRLPHKAPEAAWQPAAVPLKPPKKFAVEPLTKETFFFPADVAGNGNVVIVYLLGMLKPKLLTIPLPATRGGRGGHGRPSPRHRVGPGHLPRGGKREPSATYGDADNSRSMGRGGRGGYRTRGERGGGGGSDSWGRYTPSQRQTSMPA